MSKCTGIRDLRGIFGNIWKSQRERWTGVHLTFTFPSVQHVVVFQNSSNTFCAAVWVKRGRRGKKGLTYIRRIDCYIAFVLYLCHTTAVTYSTCGSIIPASPRSNAVGNLADRSCQLHWHWLVWLSGNSESFSPHVRSMYLSDIACNDTFLPSQTL